MFSRKAWYICSKTQSTIDFINLIDKILVDGKPEKIRSDNFSALSSKKLKKHLKNLKIEYEHTPSYSPQSIGMVERVNSTIVNQIGTIINDAKYNLSWTKAAYAAINIYNETIHSITKHPPNES